MWFAYMLRTCSTFGVPLRQFTSQAYAKGSGWQTIGTSSSILAIQNQKSVQATEGFLVTLKSKTDCVNTLHPNLFNNGSSTAHIQVQGLASFQKSNFRKTLWNSFHCLGAFRQNSILDRAVPVLGYDCPKITNLNIEMVIPGNIKTDIPLEIPGTGVAEKKSPGTLSPEKQAAVLVTIRKRKMKKHKRQKATARNYARLQKMKFLKMKRKERIFNDLLSNIKKKGEEFDAFEEIKANLEYARRKGYRVNIFGPNSKSFGFADVLKGTK